jgi:hypothetical protein
LWRSDSSRSSHEASTPATLGPQRNPVSDVVDRLTCSVSSASVAGVPNGGLPTSLGPSVAAVRGVGYEPAFDDVVVVDEEDVVVVVVVLLGVVVDGGGVRVSGDVHGPVVLAGGADSLGIDTLAAHP